jgi:hypothetical protein
MRREIRRDRNKLLFKENAVKSLNSRGNNLQPSRGYLIEGGNLEIDEKVRNKYRNYKDY